MTILQPGQMLGPYQIINQIGKGGMAAVYKAYHAAMDRYVAVKVVAVQLADDPDFMQRFRQEARLIARLEHPNILPVHDFGEDAGIPYMVMRLLDSGTLQERLASGPLSLPEVDHIFSQLTGALEYAHENGIIHRDIKPANAMLDKRGDVFLTDFGVAKMLEGSSLLSTTGAITGTPSYMSPEQAQGLKVDQRSDIYSLGIVLYEMLAGRAPFEAETPMAVLLKQIQAPPPPLSLARPDLSDSFELVLLKALAKDPADRYPTMDAFRAAWKLALAQANTLPAVASQLRPELPPVSSSPPEPARAEPVPVPPTISAVVPARPSAKRAFPLAAVLALGLVLCLGVGAFLAVFGMQAWRTRQARSQVATHAGTQAAAQSNTPVTQAGPPAVPVETPVTPPTSITSWAGANIVNAIAINGGSVLAGGEGGITTWDRAGGSYTQSSTAGLPGAVVLALFVDQDGSTWVGTDTGILHINGAERTTYATAQGLDSEYVTSIVRGGERLFAGTQYSFAAGGGLLELHGGTWQSVPGFPSSDSPGSGQVSVSVRHVTFDSQGQLWVATEHGLAMLDASGQWHVFTTDNGLPDESVLVIYAAQNNEIYAGTANGGVAKYNREKSTFETFTNLSEQGIYDVYAILQDKDGNLWFAGGAVARYNPAKNEWANFSAVNGSFPSSSASSLAIDDSGVLYFGTYGQGLVRYTAGRFIVQVVPNVPRFGEYGRILPAPAGKLIFDQLYESGADQYDPAGNTWTVIPDEQNVPRAFDAQGQMWSASGDGLWIFGVTKTTHLTTAHGLPSAQVNAVAFGKDGVAYLAASGGIAVFDGLTVKDVYTAAKNGLASDEVNSLLLASDGSLWVGVQGGFSRRLPDGTWQHFTSQGLFGEANSDYFPQFAEDRQGGIWIATGYDGVYHFSNGAWKRLLSTDPGVGLPSDQVNSVAAAPDGAIWFGTNGQGAARYDGQTWKSYSAGDGPLAGYVNDIYIDANGAAWFATNAGISRLQP